jgi:KaiC/GvpD/RAD55 family RecA-like ATPase
MAEEKFSTGVKGIDEILGGGVYKGVNVLLKGGTGTGKTTLALQFLVHGVRLGERCLYLTFEESKNQILRYGSKFFPDLKSHVDSGMIQILDFSPQTAKGREHIIEGTKVEIPQKEVVDSIAYIQDKILDIRGQTIHRVVIDSLQTFATTFYDISGKTDIDEVRRTLSKILVLLKNEGVTTYIISEEADEESDKYGFINFVVDGIFVLKVSEALDMRTLKITKMRGVKHTLKPLTIKLLEGEGITFADQRYNV